MVELEARIAMLEQELAQARSATSTRSTTLGRSQASTGEAGSGVFELQATEALTFTADTDSDSAPAENVGGGERVTLRLHETRPTILPLPAPTERLPVAAIPPVPVSVPLGTTEPSSAPPATSAVPPPSTVFAPPTVAMPAPTPAVAPVSADSLVEYRAGLAHLTARRFEAAIGSLSAFLRDNPGSAQADDALYWRATAYYALRRYREAVVDYDRIVRIAPHGDRAADALYHSALCSRRLGDDERARATFARLRREYPDSVAARLAAREDTT